MGNKKDIGAFFESKLGHGKNPPTQALWSKINNTLDTEMFRRKRIRFLWFAGFGILLSAGLVFLIAAGYFPAADPLSDKHEITVTDQQEGSLLQQNNPSGPKIIKADSIKYNSTLMQDPDMFLKDELKSEKGDSSKFTSEIPEEKLVAGSKTKQHAPKREDEVFSVTTNYHYYNSEDGKVLVTSNKHKIDSLISEKQQVRDTIDKKVSDSLRNTN